MSHPTNICSTKVPVEDNLPAIITVCGEIEVTDAGITDAHNHIWIEPAGASSPGVPVLNQRAAIMAEMADYHRAGGGTIVDCQPGGAGRDGTVMRELSQGSGVHVVACTGRHLAKYYPPGYSLLMADSDTLASYFIDEIGLGLEETRHLPVPVRAGFIKIACEATIDAGMHQLIRAAAVASAQTGVAVLAHTEKGSAAEEIAELFLDYGGATGRLVICHIDKRPDFGLHRELVQAGVMLEYDTFYRPQYEPERNLYPLITHIAEAGYANSIALATDMADSAMWRHMGGGPGLIGLMTGIIPRLVDLGIPTTVIERLTGANIAERLAVPVDRLRKPTKEVVS